jgi:hypothetical protein
MSVPTSDNSSAVSRELHQSRNSTFLSGPSDIRRRIDAEDSNAFLDKELQQISIIATEFNNPTRRS